MGATLVALAVQRWAPHISDRAFRVLVAMAVTARDHATPDVQASLYFAGQGMLAATLQRKRGGTEESALRTVKRAIEELIAAGAIERTQRSSLGTPAVYKLTLSTLPKPVDNSDETSTYFSIRRDTPSPPRRDTPSPVKGDNRSPKWGTTEVPPSRNQEEPQEELKEEESSALRSDVTVVGPGEAAIEPEEIPSQCSNPECLIGYVIDASKPKGKRSVRCPECSPQNVIPFQRRSA